MCRTSFQQNKMKRLSLSEQTPATKKRQRSQTQLHKTQHVSGRKAVSEKISVDVSSSKPTVLELMSMIGESKQDLSNETLENYMDRDLLKISQQWSQTVMKNDEECDVELNLFDESDTASRGVFTSLNEECARLEVNAVALLASMEHEMNKSFVMDQECLLGEDDEILEEMRKLEESMEMLEEELNMSEIMDYVRDDEMLKNVNEVEMKEKQEDDCFSRCLVLENMADKQICVAACA